MPGTRNSSKSYIVSKTTSLPYSLHIVCAVLGSFGKHTAFQQLGRHAFTTANVQPLSTTRDPVQYYVFACLDLQDVTEELLYRFALGGLAGVACMH